MKKIALLTSLVLIATVCALALVGCYVSKPATMSDLVGVYQLTKFTRTHTSTDENGESQSTETDLMAERGITAFLVVGDNGFGYYVYKDNDGLSAKQVAITYTYDDEDTDKIKEISYSDGFAASGDGFPGKGKETLGLTFQKKEKTLNYNYAQINGKLIKRDYSQSVSYTKVANGADLSFVERKIGTSLSIPDMRIAGLNGWQVHEDFGAEEEYVYYYIDLNVVEKKADVYFMRREDKIQQSAHNLDVTFTIPEVADAYITIRIGNNVFYCDNSTKTPALNVFVLGTNQDIALWFTHYASADFDVQQHIQTMIDSLAQ